MTEQEIRDEAPSGATHYLLLKTVNVGDHIIYFRNSIIGLCIHSTYSGWIEDRRTRLTELKPL